MLVAAPAFAANDPQDIPPSPIVKTALVVDAPATQNSNRVWVGVTFTMPEHWHIYYKDPGDSGIPTTMEWTLPAGWKAGEIVWPAYERIDVSGIMNNGYSNQVTLPVELTAAGAPSGNISVTAKWLVCKEVCIPESATLTAILPTQTPNAREIIAAARASAAGEAPAATSNDTGLLRALVLAFLGGLLLNIMPCVLPILALKALAITKKASASRREAARQGLAYTAGVVLSFLVIAGGMLALKASGAAIGWGFQLQNATFVAALAGVMLLVAANLLGWFELPVLFGARATAVDDSTRSGSFFTGALAVLVATPCTAPFMATAVGATLTLPPFAALLVFAALGLGMAAPFLLISVWPAARRLLPKAGPWMHRFKQLLAIPMLATAAWLIWVFVQLQFPSGKPMDVTHETFSTQRLEMLRAEGTPVLVDVTADWCLTCKINERVAFHPQAMQDFLHEKKVILLVADWTAADAEITAYLAQFGRNGVPLYVYYPPHGEPVVLPQVLSPSLIRSVVMGGT